MQMLIKASNHLISLLITTNKVAIKFDSITFSARFLVRKTTYVRNVGFISISSTNNLERNILYQNKHNVQISSFSWIRRIRKINLGKLNQILFYLTKVTESIMLQVIIIVMRCQMITMLMRINNILLMIRTYQILEKIIRGHLSVTISEAIQLAAKDQDNNLIFSEN